MKAEDYDQYVTSTIKFITDEFERIKTNRRDLGILKNRPFSFQMPIAHCDRVYQWGQSHTNGYAYLGSINRQHTAFTLVQHAMFKYASVYVIDTSRHPSSRVHLTMSLTKPEKIVSATHGNNNYDEELIKLVSESL